MHISKSAVNLKLVKPSGFPLYKKLKKWFFIVIEAENVGVIHFTATSSVTLIIIKLYKKLKSHMIKQGNLIKSFLRLIFRRA